MFIADPVVLFLAEFFMVIVLIVDGISIKYHCH